MPNGSAAAAFISGNTVSSWWIKAINTLSRQIQAKSNCWVHTINLSCSKLWAKTTPFTIITYVTRHSTTKKRTSTYVTWHHTHMRYFTLSYTIQYTNPLTITLYLPVQLYRWSENNSMTSLSHTIHRTGSIYTLLATADHKGKFSTFWWYVCLTHCDTPLPNKMILKLNTSDSLNITASPYRSYCYCLWQ